MIKKFLEIFNLNLDMALADKTSWGRNDLKLVIATVIQDSLAEMMG
jgi:hypothetical protein